MKEHLWRPDVAVASHGPLVVQSIAARFTVPMMNAMMEATLEHRAEYGSRALSLSVMKPKLEMPDDETRARIKEINARPDAGAISVVVIEGSGFWAGAMRGVLASIALVNKKAPIGSSSVQEALQLLAPHLPGEDLAQLERDIVAFRQRHLGA